METIYHCCKTLQANVNVVDRRLGLADILTRALAALDKCKSAAAANTGSSALLSDAASTVSNDEEQLAMASSHLSERPSRCDRRCRRPLEPLRHHRRRSQSDLSPDRRGHFHERHHVGPRSLLQLAFGDDRGKVRCVGLR